MPPLTAANVMDLLNLRPLPREGGFYRETYRAAEHIRPGKALATAIYYLLTPQTFSALHRLPTDEIFHFYLGSSVTMLQLGPDGGRTLTLGNDLDEGQQPQVLVPRGVWQGSFTEGEFALLGTTMAPGFDSSDYEAGDRAELTARYPRFAGLIERLTSG
jgi:predicted cupin superfamily sugar epimerase